MSHFTVLVIGDDHDALLAPFHEFECTGTNDQYVQDVDVTEIAREKGLDWHGLEDKTITDMSQLDIEGDHKFGYALVDADGNLIKAVNRTNPKAQWDWYQVGGRWSGFLKLKPGATGGQGERSWTNEKEPVKAGVCDTALAGDVDWLGMMEEARKEAGEMYDKVIAVIAGREVTLWEEFVKQVGDGAITIEQARVQYNGQQAIRDLSAPNGPLHHYFGSAEVVTEVLKAESRDAYTDRKAKEDSGTWAMITPDGEWHEKGEMGWFGWNNATDETKASFAEAWWRTVLELPPDTRVTLVDCHI